MDELMQLIEAKGLKLDWIAEALGISRKTLYSRLKGDRSFKLAEINTLASILSLDKEDVTRIFLTIK